MPCRVIKTSACVSEGLRWKKRAGGCVCVAVSVHGGRLSGKAIEGICCSWVGFGSMFPFTDW